MTCFVSYLGQLDGKCIENRVWLCVEHEFQVTWLLLGHRGNSLSFCVCLCLYLYPCLSLSTPVPTTLVFHVTHSIPSRTAGQGYTATKKKKSKNSYGVKKKKNRNSGYHSLIYMLPVSIQMLSPTEHSCKKQSFDFPFVFTNPSSLSTQKTPTHPLQVLGLT